MGIFAHVCAMQGLSQLRKVYKSSSESGLQLQRAGENTGEIQNEGRRAGLLEGHSLPQPLPSVMHVKEDEGREAKGAASQPQPERVANSQ